MADESRSTPERPTGRLRRRAAPGAARDVRVAGVLVAALVTAVSVVTVLRPASAGGCDYADGKLLGSPGPDRCRGTRDRDRIYGFGAGDHLLGRRGRDVLRGHEGGDRLSGGPGRDRILDAGDRGDHDVVCAGGGADDLNVMDGDGADEVYAQLADDDVSWDPGDHVDNSPCPF